MGKVLVQSPTTIPILVHKPMVPLVNAMVHPCKYLPPSYPQQKPYPSKTDISSLHPNHLSWNSCDIMESGKTMNFVTVQSHPRL